MDISLVLIFIALGAFVGFMAGLLGIGGGGVLVPVLTTIFIYQQVPVENVVHLALGTSMACITITSLSSMRAHHANGAVVWRLVKLMTPGVVLGTFLATFLAASASSKTLAIFFAIFMAYVAFKMFRTVRGKVGGKAGVKEAGKPELSAVSFVIGAVSALVSIGGGSLTVPYLTWRSVDVRKAIGTSAALGFPIALTGTFGYLLNGILSGNSMPNTFGFVYLPAVLLVSVLSFFTAPLGARFTQRLPVGTLKKVFGLLLLVLSLKMLIAVI